MQRLTKTQESSGLLVINIDHFKLFNDNHGHVIGDKVLTYIAFALKQAVKGSDFIISR